MDVDGTCESSPKKTNKKHHCLNIACKSTINLTDANAEEFTYYGVNFSKSNNKICVICKEVVLKHFQELFDKFISDDCLLKVALPTRQELVFIDSDEEIDLSSDSDVEDNEEYDEEALKLINEECDNLLATALPKDKVMGHVKRAIDQLDKGIDKFLDEMKEQNTFLDEQQKILDNINVQFYKPFRNKLEELPPLDLPMQEDPPSEEEQAIQETSPKPMSPRLLDIVQNTTPAQQLQKRPFNSRNTADDVLVEERRSNTSRPLNLPRMPPLGVPITGAPITLNSFLWVMKNNLLGAWSQCQVIKIIEGQNNIGAPTKRYLVKLLHENKTKLVSGKYLAYTEPNTQYMYRVGMRVISIFGNATYYSGTVAEIPKETNRWRYLIFFDDGYFSYSNHENILMICQPSDKAYDDVPTMLRDFIRDYLVKYPERAMVKMQVGENMPTLYKNKWMNAKVLEIDCSLARLQYFTTGPNAGESDWIFRGSDRLRPLYESKMNAARRKEQANKVQVPPQQTDFVTPMFPVHKVQTARKSLSGKNKPQVYFESGEKKVQWTPVKVPSKVIYKKAEDVEVFRSQKFTPHACGKACVNWIRWSFDYMIKRVNLLAIPLYTGFTRILHTFNDGKKVIIYVGPCGRRLRGNEELMRYLQATRSKWTIDMFEFDHFVDCLREYVIDNANITIKDISYGRENVPISCVNYIDTDVPKTVDYMTARKPKEGVSINTSSDFLVCCDCTDDCLDRDTCACWQLTIKANKDLLRGRHDFKEFVGYQNKRLPEHLVSGIYECNDRCKCAKTCHNRVVQFPLVQKLQLFKTEMKGWGLRCMNDIPQGTFICIYAGHLLTDNDANEEGKNYGDEYLAELDFIECMERTKEGYESDVPDDSDSSDGSGADSNEDENSRDLEHLLADDNQDIRKRLRKRKQKKRGKNGEGQRAQSSMMATLKASQRKKNNKEKFKSLREYYGDNESVYIMDARTSGNIGRYLNHSCSPNVFVQNVFVDTHDPRFPWVSFFALKYIEAGSELTWDYAYDIGSVPNKVVYCYCGSSECRHRLL